MKKLLIGILAMSATATAGEFEIDGNCYLPRQVGTWENDQIGIEVPNSGFFAGRYTYWKVYQINCSELCYDTWTWRALTDNPESWVINWEPQSMTAPSGYSGSIGINASAHCVFAYQDGATTYYNCSYTVDLPDIIGGYNVSVLRYGVVVNSVCID